VKALLTIARLALGLFAAVAVLGGVINILYGLANGAPWAVLLGALINALLAFAVAYGALNHFPWERRATSVRVPPNERST
jgi:hypothetical protein